MKSRAKKNRSMYKGLKKVDRLQNKRIRTIENKLAGIETRHFFTYEPTSLGVPRQDTNAVIVTAITSIIQGDSDTDRSGDKVNIKYLNMALHQWANTTGQGQHIRYLIFQDRSYAGTVATGANLLQQYSVTNIDQTNMMSPLNPDRFPMIGDTKLQKTAKPYRVIKDFIISNPSYTGTGGAVNNKFKRFTIRWKAGKAVQYSGASDRYGTIFVAVFPGTSTTAGNNPYYTWQTTLGFTDL